MENKPFFSERELKIITRPTPSNELEEKVEDGKKVKYVRGSYVKKVLNELFNYNWQETIVKTDLFPNPNPCVIVHLRLTATTESGFQVYKEQFGGAYVDKSLPYAYKAAATDALKKCAAEIGLFSDVYTDEKITEPKALDSPLSVIAELRKECIDLEITFTKEDSTFFDKTVKQRNQGNYDKCIFKLKEYIAKTQKQ